MNRLKSFSDDLLFYHSLEISPNYDYNCTNLVKIETNYESP